MAHTSGPWKVVSEEGHHPGVDASNRTIVMIGHKRSVDDGGIRGASDLEAIYNATLIASAPELLRELTDIKQELDRMSEQIDKVLRAAMTIPTRAAVSF